MNIQYKIAPGLSQGNKKILIGFSHNDNLISPHKHFIFFYKRY